MSPKLLASVVLASLILTTFNTAKAQTQQVVGATFFQPTAVAQEVETDEDLREQLKKMQLRLRELEHDLEEKLGAVPDAEETEEVYEQFDERFEALEETVEEQSESINLLEDADEGFLTIGGSDTKKAKFFGRIHIDYWAFPDTDDEVTVFEGENPQDRFSFRRIRIGASGELSNNIVYKYEGEFAGGANASYRDVYVGAKDLPFLNTLLIGNQKRPYGLDHLNSSKTNVFIERPLIVEALNQDARRLGIASYGLSEDQKYNWRYGVFNKRLTQNIGQFVGDHYQLEVAGRLAATPWYDESSGGRGYLHVAVSGSVGFPDGRGGPDNEAEFRTRPEARSTNRWIDTGQIVGADVSSLAGIETVLNIGAWHFTGEYLGVNVERSAGFGQSLQFRGGYFQVGYMLTGEHHSWNRKNGTLGRVKPFENFFAVRDCENNTRRGLGAWQIAARYSRADFNDQDILGGDGESLTIGLNWWWTTHARWQFNYINGEIDRPDIGDGTGNYDIFGIRFAVDF